jgi:hypothetical protein
MVFNCSSNKPRILYARPVELRQLHLKRMYMADVYLVSIIRCSESEGFSLPLLQHFFHHYLTCGVKGENMRIALDCETPMPEVELFLQASSIDFTEIISSRNDRAQIDAQRRDALKALPEDAWITAPSLEEFIAFPTPISQLVIGMEKAGYDSLGGWIWDRFDQNFILKKIDPSHPINLQFPVATEFSANNISIDTRRDVLVHNRVFYQGRAFYPAPAAWEIRIDAYKWTANSAIKIKASDNVTNKLNRASEHSNNQRLKSLIQETPRGIALRDDLAHNILAKFTRPVKALPTFRFIHIPKTAGTTMFQIVKQWFPNLKRIIAWHKLRRETQMSLNSEKIIFGHVPLRHLFFEDGGNTLWFTILRNPIDQAISCYYEHARNLGRRPIEHQELIREGLETLLLSGRFIYIWPRSIRFLSSVPLDADDSEAADSAKENLRKFTLVGFYDELEYFIGKMAAALGFPPPDIIPHANYNPNKPETPQLSADAKRALEQITALDMEVYNYAKSLSKKSSRAKMQCFESLITPNG